MNDFDNDLNYTPTWWEKLAANQYSWVGVIVIMLLILYWLL